MVPRVVGVLAVLCCGILAGCVEATKDPAEDPTPPPDDPAVPRSGVFDPPVAVGWAPLSAEPLIRSNGTGLVIFNFGAAWSSRDGATWQAAAPLSCPDYDAVVRNVCPPGRGTPQTEAVGRLDDEVLWSDGWFRLGLGGGHGIPLQEISDDLASFGEPVDIFPSPGQVDRPWARADPWHAIVRRGDESILWTTRNETGGWTTPQAIAPGGMVGPFAVGGAVVAFPVAPYGPGLRLVAWDGAAWTVHEVQAPETNTVYGAEAWTAGFPALAAYDGTFVLMAGLPEGVRVAGSVAPTRLMVSVGAPDAMPEMRPFGAGGTAAFPWAVDLGDAVGFVWLEAPSGLAAHAPQDWHLFYAEWNGSWSEPVDVLGGPAFFGSLCTSTTSGAACKLGTGGPVDFLSAAVLDGRPVIAYAVPEERSATIWTVRMTA